MNVLVSGASGLIGSALKAKLQSQGHTVVGLGRSPEPGEIGWDPNAGRLDRVHLAGLDAAVHLAGESLAGGRWTAAKKREILDSRVQGTRLLAESLAGLQPRPSVLVVASAVGYYGPRPGQELDEDSPSGSGFLADVCRQWEASANAAREAGIRTVNTRFGIVLSPKGGALKQLLPVAKLGLFGPVGHGRQVWSWVALDDVAGALAHVLATDSLSGPVNVVAPNPVPQREFAATLGRVLGRPAFLPLPEIAARLVLGEMAEEMLLPSQHVVPRKLLASGYQFAFTDLEAALRAMV